MTTSLADLTARPALAAFAGLALVIALAAGPVSGAIETADRIAQARDSLARAQAALARPPTPAPLVGAGPDALLAAFRGRLEALSAERAAVVDRTVLEADPTRPDLPRLRAALRGTAEGLQGLLHALETQGPLVLLEEAEVGIDRQADPDLGRPTSMRLSLTVRGVLLPIEAEARATVPGAVPGTVP